jgi:hypothetical protein
MVGLSVRLVNPRNGITVWSCTRSREGNDGESVFGIGKVHSISKMSEIVVDDICGQMAPAAADIAKLLERKGGEIEPIVKPLDDEAVRPAAPDADEEQEEVRRAVKRHWQLIEESRGR